MGARLTNALSDAALRVALHWYLQRRDRSGPRTYFVARAGTYCRQPLQRARRCAARRHGGPPASAVDHRGNALEQALLRDTVCAVGPSVNGEAGTDLQGPSAMPRDGRPFEGPSAACAPVVPRRSRCVHRMPGASPCPSTPGVPSAGPSRRAGAATNRRPSRKSSRHAGIQTRETLAHQAPDLLTPWNAFLLGRKGNGREGSVVDHALKRI